MSNSLPLAAGGSLPDSSVTAPLLPPPPPPFQRRSAVLGSLAAALVAPAIERATAEPAPDPDAELIGLCRRHTRLSRQAHALLNAMPEHYGHAAERAYWAQHIEPLEEEQKRILDHTEGLRARSVTGLLARIEMLVAEYSHLTEGECDRGEMGIISAILLDGLALKAGGAA